MVQWGFTGDVTAQSINLRSFWTELNFLFIVSFNTSKEIGLQMK